MMKRLIKLFTLTTLTLTALFILSFGANAAIAGDVAGNDKKVTATDARLILRVSVNLDTLTTELSAIADVNEDGKVSAADARDVLRMSVGLVETRHFYTKQVIKAPTCTETGKNFRECTECDDSYYEDVKALGHTYPNPTILVQVTCEKDGLAKYTCRRCGESKEEVIKAGHVWEAATCTEPQYCIRGHHTGAPALGHTTTWGKCTRCQIFNTQKYASAAEIIKKEFPVAKDKGTYGYNILQQSSTGAVGWLKDYATDAKPVYQASKASYQAAYNACADIPELASLKANLGKALENTNKILAQIDVILATSTITDQNFVALMSAIDTPQWENDNLVKKIEKAILW